MNVVLRYTCEYLIMPFVFHTECNSTLFAHCKSYSTIKMAPTAKTKSNRLKLSIQTQRKNLGLGWQKKKAAWVGKLLLCMARNKKLKRMTGQLKADILAQTQAPFSARTKKFLASFTTSASKKSKSQLKDKAQCHIPDKQKSK